MHSCQNNKNYPLFHPLKLGIIMAFMVFVLVFSGLSYAQNLFIKDGDSFVLNGEEIRLWGVDAVELSQFCHRDKRDYACGKLAKAHLQKLLENAAIRCEKMPAARRETRTVAKCFIGERDIGGEMVRAGWAIDYRYFSKGYYSKAQDFARGQKIGIWQGRFEEPRNWRKSQPYKYPFKRRAARIYQAE